MKLSVAINALSTTALLLFLPGLSYAIDNNKEETNLSASQAGALLRTTKTPPSNDLMLDKEIDEIGIHDTSLIKDTTLAGVLHHKDSPQKIPLLRDLSANDWTQLGVVDGISDNDNFGYSVSVSKAGARLAVGAWAHDNWGGYMKVFDLIGTSLVQVGTTIFGNPNRQDPFQVGRVVSMSEDGSRVGTLAPGGSGSVLVYEWKDNDWSPVGDVVSGLGAWSDAFAMSGDGKRFVVGTSTYKWIDSSTRAVNGKAEIYEEVGGEWMLVKEIDSPNDNDYFGYSVDLSFDGMEVVVGVPYSLNDSLYPRTNAGLARVYKQVGNDWDSWEQVGSDLELPGAILTDKFGYKVGMSKTGDRVIVGAYEESQAVVFEQSGGEWFQLGQVLEQGGVIGSVSMSHDGERVAVGSFYTVGAHVYELDSSFVWNEVGNAVTGPNSYGKATSLSSDGMTLGVGNSGSYVVTPPGKAGLYYTPPAPTQAPSTAPTSTCFSCCEEVKSQMKTMEDKMDNMDDMLMTILDLMLQGSTTPAPSSAPVTSCVDKQGKFEHNGSNRNWCRIAQNANNTNKACRNIDLYDVCPVTCGRCSTEY